MRACGYLCFVNTFHVQAKLFSGITPASIACILRQNKVDAKPLNRNALGTSSAEMQSAVVASGQGFS